MQYLLSQLAELNIKVKVVDQQLHINAPAGVMTKELANALKEHKQELVTLIAGNRSAQFHPLPTIKADIANRFEPFPLTAIQHAYWMGRSQAKIELGGVSTHLYFESDAKDIDLGRLEECFNRLVARHDMLRVVISDDGIQQVLPSIPRYIIKNQDLTGQSEEIQQQGIKNVRSRMSHQVLATDKAPIIEIFASRTNDKDAVLHFSLDMLVLDAWSMMLLFKELYTLYADPKAVLPSINIMYRDYALAEERLSETVVYKEAKDYWWGIIDNLPPAPQIPLRSDAVANPPKFTRRRFRMPKERWAKLQSMAKSRGVTPTGVVLSAFTEVLTLWSSSPHYTLNVTLFNRQPLHPHVNSLLGDFTSLLLLEVDHREGGTFADRLTKTQARFMRDLENRAISGLEVMRELRRRRSAMMEAAMPVVFTGGLVYSGDGDDAGLLESFGPMVYGVSQTPQVSLDHQVMEVNGDLVCNWDCVDEKFAPGMLDALYNTFCQLLDRLVDEEALWDRSSVIDIPHDQRLLRNQVNATDVESSSDELLHTLFVKHAIASPSNIAIICDDGKAITYGELLAMANDLASKLNASGVAVESCVAVVMHKGWQQMVAILATHIAGGAYLPISSSFPVKRQNLLIEQASARIVLTQPDVVEDLDLEPGIEYYVVELNQHLPLVTCAPPVRQQRDSLAYVLFTSGTTGMPKGVMIEHRNAFNTVFYVNQVLGVTAQDRVLAVSALNFDLSVYDVFGTLSAGGTLIIPNHKKLTDPEHWLSLINAHGVTLWNSAPALMGMLVDHMEVSELGSRGASMRLVCLSGDKIPVPLPNRVKACFKNSRFISLGGPTETSIWSIYYPVEVDSSDWASIPYGKPLPNQSIHILNNRLQDCPEGVAGTIYIAGEGVGRGYLGDQEKTDEKFIDHPISGMRLYDSGDLGRYLPDGNIEILGRSDFQVKIRGYRIELGEITSALLQHKDIKHAVVMPVLCDDGNKQIAAYIVPENDANALCESNEESGTELFNCSLQELSLQLVEPLTHAIPDDSFFQLYKSSIKKLLAGFGVGERQGQTFDLFDFDKLGILPEYRIWMTRALSQLASTGCIQIIDNSEAHYEVCIPWQFDTVDREIDVITQVLVEGNDYKQGVEFLVNACKDLYGVVNGTYQLIDVHYLGDSRQEFLQMENGQYHLQICNILESLVNHTAGSINLLEVGAGVGALTKMISERLSNASMSYLVTDAREEHLEYIYENIATQFENIELGLYDYNIDAQSQGLFKDSFHVIVASSALWRSDDAEYTLKQLHSLIKPNGFLIIAEPSGINARTELGQGLLTPVQHHQLFSGRVPLDMFSACGFETLAIKGNYEEQDFDIYLARAKPSKSLDSTLVKKYLAEYLPDYMVPHHIVSLTELPVTINGKVDYKALPGVNSQGLVDSLAVVAPRNELEQAIYDGWMTVIQLPEVGVNQEFFDVGGDSLLAARVVREVNERLPSFKLEMFEFFENLTIEAQANLFARRGDCNSKVRQVEDVATSLKFDSSVIESDVAIIQDQLSAIDYQYKKNSVKSEPDLLLTGATGWLGGYILYELLNRTDSTIVCVGRAKDSNELYQRIIDNLNTYSLELSENQLSRISPLLGDMKQRQLGIDSEQWLSLQNSLGGIYHAAAAVGIASSYADMRAANLGAVTEIAKLSLSGGGIPIFFCSSVALLIQFNGHEFSIHKSETPVESPEGLIVGYAQSKWAAESVLFGLIERNVPVKIYRIAHVLPDTNTGFAKESYIFESVLSVAGAVSAIPADSAARFYGIPVDIAARALVESSITEDGYSGAIHMDNQHPVDLRSLLMQMYEVQAPERTPSLPEVASHVWLEMCRDARSDLPVEAQTILNFLLEPTTHGTMFEALYNAEPSDMTYLQEHASNGGQSINHITGPDYWVQYFSKKRFVKQGL